MKNKAALVSILLLLAVWASGQERQGYYRFPALRGESIVFVSEGDLWTVDALGGLAMRLTTHPGLESNPAISPDGRTIAFSAQYEGPTEIYTMSMEGGLPTRRTFSGQGAVVVGWTPDGRILYATRKYSTLPNMQLVMIDLLTHREALVPLAQASDGSFDGTGRTLFFTRLPFQGSYTKLYQGGTAQNIWRFNGRDEAEPLTGDWPGTSKNPLWYQGKIYFLSDRDGTMNLWMMREDGGGLKQLTFHKGLDASSPCIDQGRIVYQLVADLHVYDIAGKRDQKLDITLASDFDQMREKWIPKPMEYLTSAHLSPSGDRLALTARGRVFVTPAVEGRSVKLTTEEGVRHRSARFWPDGKSVLALADDSGEWEFYRYPANGLGQRQRLTQEAKVIRFDGRPSPDSKYLAFGDKNYQLWVHRLETHSDTLVATSNHGMIDDFAWSPDSKWLAFVMAADNLFAQIRLYNIETGSLTELTSDRVDCYNPVFSSDGKWLYFVSDRQFQSVVPSPWGPRQPEPFFDRISKVYALALNAKERFLFLPSDELSGEPQPAPEKKNEEKGGKKADLVIDLSGLPERVYEVPLPAGAYVDFDLNDKAMFWLEPEKAGGAPSRLQVVEFRNRVLQVKTLAEGVNGFELSLDGKKLLLRKGDDLYVIDAVATPPAQLAEKKVNLSGWTFAIDPRSEWRQMLVDAWRMERDYFYDRGLHGVDYQGLLQRHLPYLQRISDRSELNDLLAHLVGELSALHTFVRGGDLRRGGDDIVPASLGARLVRDEKNGGYRVEHIFQSDPNYPDKLAPLARPETRVREGDIITAINGVPLLGVADPSLLLRNCAGQQVLIEIKAQPDGALRSLIVYPIASNAESDLRYEEWEYTRRLHVEKAGNGKIGYLHLRAMGGGNYAEWVRHFYPVFNRQGLILDVRNNRGGNIDSWILEKLLRKAWFFWQGRVGKPTWNMQYAFRGHMVVICNEFTASDGEAFAEGFRRLGLGKIIGTRTWGGEIWLSQSNTLVDRGLASAAETGVFGPEREWLIEGHGVDPDICVDNLPHATFTGRDAQLEEAIRHLQENIRQDPVLVPEAPPYPDKSKKRKM